MGDVGSQFIGSMFPLILFAIGADTLILFFCFLYIVEALSVIIQVLSFKYRGKRVFKMTPIHHHFEMSNWAETTIIVRFWIINGIVIVIGLGLFYGDWVCLVIKKKLIFGYGATGKSVESYFQKNKIEYLIHDDKNLDIENHLIFDKKKFNEIDEVIISQE